MGLLIFLNLFTVCLRLSDTLDLSGFPEYFFFKEKDLCDLETFFKKGVCLIL